MHKIKDKLLLSILCFLCILGPARYSNALDSLTLGVHPFKPSTILYDSFSPLALYLSEKTARPVSLDIAKTYEEHIEAIGKDRIDIAYMGPAPYVKLTGRYGIKPVLASLEVEGRGTFHGVIIVRKDSPIKSLTDLRGKRFLFGDQNSTMSYLVPKYLLRQEGVDLKDLSSFGHATNHHSVALGVLASNYDAGAVKESIFKAYKDRGLRALIMTPPIPTHLFVTRSGLPDEIVDILRAALMELNDIPEGGEIMHAIKPGVTGIIPADDSDYDGLRNIMRELEGAGH